MDLEAFQSLCRYVDFDAASEQRLTAMLPHVRSDFRVLIDDFYRAIQRHPEAHGAIAGGEAQVARLRKSLEAWLVSLFQGPHDAAYLERHSRIGRVHVEIGLPQHFMFTAMNRIRIGLMQLVDAAGLEPMLLNRRAIDQVLDLELAVMLDTYREESHRRVRLSLDQATTQGRMLEQYEDLSQRLEESERRTREIIDGVPAFVAVLDSANKIAFWNRQLERVTGYGQAEMLGSPGDGMMTTEGAVRLPLKAGGHRLARWQQTRVELDNGWSTTYLLGVDVTDEAEMQRRANRAERLAAVGTLAAGLAHEVRNPLNSASLQLQTLQRRVKKGAPVEGLSPIIERVQEEILRLDGLVGDFLAFARPGALELKPTDLNHLLEAVVALLRPEVEGSDIAIVMDLDATVGTLNVDAGQLRQVVHNLIRNATEAMHDGGTLTVRTRGADERAQVTLEIADTGSGFASQAPVFDAFYTTKSNGTGLGLAIVHRIVQEHGGSIEAQSSPGRTAFVIRLPQPRRDF